MMQNPAKHDPFETVMEEHHRLRELLALIGNLLNRRPRSTYRVASLFEELEAYLRSHFAHEEHGGYLHEALALAPQFSDRAARLVGEHDGLLQMAREMHNAIDRRSVVCDWNAIAAQFDAFTQQFVAHETDENGLIQEAMLRDMAAED